MNKNERISGVLLPISSLPSPYGIGTLGKEAYDFIDFLKSAGVKIWQMLPLNVTSYGDSPYQSPSSTGLNYYFIDLRNLISQGLLTEAEVKNADLFSVENRVDYGKLFRNRIPLLKKAFSRFDRTDAEFCSFVEKGEYNDFSFFMTLKTINHFSAWYDWSDEYRNYTPELENRLRKENEDLFLFFQWTQFEFLREFEALKKYGNSQGISFLGDMPLYLAYDSVEAYKYPNLFLFDDKHNPTVVAGVPPDYFSADGQLWGNPIYDWEGMKKDGYSWFNERIRRNLALFDILRIDHFRGFSSYYEVPFGMTNARVGQWKKGPGMDFFQDKKDLPIVAEDLGTLDDGVYELLRESTYPGMKVLQFAFDGGPDNPHKPSNSGTNYFCYTGTHDNMPLRGYLESASQDEVNRFREDVRRQCEIFHIDYRADTIRDLVLTVDTLCYASPCMAAILPLQDLLASGAESRLNLPSSLSDKNWTYRCSSYDFNDSLRSFIHRNITKFNR